MVDTQEESHIVENREKGSNLDEGRLGGGCSEEMERHRYWYHGSRCSGEKRKVRIEARGIVGISIGIGGYRRSRSRGVSVLVSSSLFMLYVIVSCCIGIDEGHCRGDRVVRYR